jgi:hypothetical protein
MSEDNPGAGPIEKPKSFPKRKALRAIARAAAGSVPVAGPALAEVADAFLPDHEARDRNRWEGEITDGVNDLYSRVDDGRGGHHVTISGVAAELAAHFIKRCPDGLARDDISRDQLTAAFPNLTRDELLDGLGVLEMYRLIESMEFANDEAIYTLTESAYEALDPAIMGWNTREDARHIAALAADKRDYVMTYELEKAVGWPRRRFNPAHRLVVEMIDSAHVSDELQPHYVTPQFNPSNAETARLRLFAAGG